MDDSDSEEGFVFDYGDHHEDTDTDVESMESENLRAHAPPSPHYEIQIYVRTWDENATSPALSIVLSDNDDTNVTAESSSMEHEILSDSESEEIPGTPPNESLSEMIEILEATEELSDDETEHIADMEFVDSEDEDQSSFSSDIDITQFFGSENELDETSRPDSEASDLSPNETLGTSDIIIDLTQNSKLAESVASDRSDMEMSVLQYDTDSSDMDLFEIVELEESETSDHSDLELYQQNDTLNSMDMQFSQSSEVPESVSSDNPSDDLIQFSETPKNESSRSSDIDRWRYSDISQADSFDHFSIDPTFDTSEMHLSQDTKAPESVCSDDEIFELLATHTDPWERTELSPDDSSGSLDMDPLQTSELSESDNDELEDWRNFSASSDNDVLSDIETDY